MTTGEWINVGLLFINFLMFLAMFLTLLVQNKTIKLNQNAIETSNKELKNSMTSLKVQLITSIIQYKQSQLETLDKTKGLNDQKSYKQITDEINLLSSEITLLLKQFKTE